MQAVTGLAIGRDGALYGVARVGQVQDVAYRVGLDGSFSTVASFPDEFGPVFGQLVTALTLGSDGRLYGARAGDRNLLFSVDTEAHTARLLYEFPRSGSNGEPNPNGAFPRGRLLEVAPAAGQDLALLGITSSGGGSGRGVIFRLDVTHEATSDADTLSKVASG